MLSAAADWEEGMAEYYLAVDIGASSGRHILGHVEGVINSYREGLIYFMQDRHLCKEDTIEELRLQAVLSDYNRQLQAFTERLAAYGCGRLAWEVLKL